MADNTFYADGQWNVTCDLCGKKVKSSGVMKTWDNQYVCRHHKEERNPQDFLRGIRDNQSVPFSRPVPPLQFVTSSWQLLQLNGGGLLQQPDSLGNSYYILVA
jgi:hypothetical protein